MKIKSDERNQLGIQKNLKKRQVTSPKVRFGKEVKFSGPYGSLEVIKRSYVGHLVVRIQLCLNKNNEKKDELKCICMFNLWCFLF